jgi:hypothetical protein
MKADTYTAIALLFQRDIDVNGADWRLQFVLSDFAVHLASHFGRSLSNHSYGYALSNDQPNCFASYTAILESFMNYPG